MEMASFFAKILIILWINIFLLNSVSSFAILRKNLRKTSTKSHLVPEKENVAAVVPSLQMQKVENRPGQKRILVLGASGRIGRLVVKQLLDLNVPVSAYVRNYKNATMIFAQHLDGYIHNSTFQLVRRSDKPLNLKIFEGNLIPEDASERDVFGYETLEDALRDCDVIISCTGTVRRSRIEDFIPPWRIWKTDVNEWCSDRRHPFYVNYIGMKKLIELVKLELQRRKKSNTGTKDRTSSDGKQRANKIAGSSNDDDLMENMKKTDGNILIVRISDLNVEFPPWSLVPILSNLIRSMTICFQKMSDDVLRTESGDSIKSIILRPGDLIDGERDEAKVALQLAPEGTLPGPAYVSRYDVAALAVSLALLKGYDDSETEQIYSSSTIKRGRTDVIDKKTIFSLPPTTTLAVRWVGESNSFIQGKKEFGYRNAEACVRNFFFKSIDQKKIENGIGEKSNSTKLVETHSGSRLRSTSGYYVAVLAYTCFGLTLKMIFQLLLLAKAILVSRKSFSPFPPFFN